MYALYCYFHQSPQSGRVRSRTSNVPVNHAARYQIHSCYCYWHHLHYCCHDYEPMPAIMLIYPTVHHVVYTTPDGTCDIAIRYQTMFVDCNYYDSYYYYYRYYWYSYGLTELAAVVVEPLPVLTWHGSYWDVRRMMLVWHPMRLRHPLHTVVRMMIQ